MTFLPKAWQTFFEQAGHSTMMVGSRYALLAGVAWLLGYVLFKRHWQHRKIVPKQPRREDVWREVRASAVTVVIFGLMGALTYLLVRSGHTQMYRKLGQYGAVWFWASIACTIMLHDTYFYWTHRLVHHPRLFRWWHREHHRSHNPTPWAAYAFSPLEAIMQAGIFPLTVLLVPIHPYAFGLFMLWQIAFNVAGHSGYEFYPRWFMKTPLGYILNTPTNHVMHHETMRGNFGLYFNFWDRLMKTNHPEYEQRFAEITTREAAPARVAAVENAS